MGVKTVLLGTVLMGLSFSASASTLTDTCLQQPNRTLPCPHQLYRLMQLPDQQTAAVRCICVTDFQPFLQQPESEVAQIRQRMDRRQLEAQLGMELEPILRVLRRED
ncbi:hypothetical protein QWY20_09735 [Alkalimonas sp. MEB108]|uniref:Secreted protein n=1 Tax=Alkalimonas cellulosilytica TaxID=3058395 RepID=A0ABU7J5F8_9GAMM|nr:hypothetical protein [Alkalimonas sp. MEB108]MEE2001733.1 hypothetical protein [Alkalimonas sp. MEB108]